jgi:hypothetical protein
MRIMKQHFAQRNGRMALRQMGLGRASSREDIAHLCDALSINVSPDAVADIYTALKAPNADGADLGPLTVYEPGQSPRRAERAPRPDSATRAQQLRGTYGVDRDDPYVSTGEAFLRANKGPLNKMLFPSVQVESAAFRAEPELVDRERSHKVRARQHRREFLSNVEQPQTRAWTARDACRANLLEYSRSDTSALIADPARDDRFSQSRGEALRQLQDEDKQRRRRALEARVQARAARTAGAGAGESVVKGGEVAGEPMPQPQPQPQPQANE